MEVMRDRYLDRLLIRRWNRKIKVITGIRRCGKSYLLFTLFRNRLIAEGVDEERIIAIALDEIENAHLREPLALIRHLKELTSDPSKQYYVLLDEIQMVKDFEDVANSLIKKTNLDVYVTGSNSKGLSSDIKTEFRGRGDEVRVHPLSFSEFSSAFPGSETEAWREYSRYGGMPETVLMQSNEQKTDYLRGLMSLVYKKDMEERHQIDLPDELDIVLNVLCSSVGSLTNPARLANTMRTEYRRSVTDDTVNRYIGIIEDSFLFEKATRYDIKGRKSIGSPFKYYIDDVGLRNALLNFRSMDLPHIMENIIFTELRSRGYLVDVGVVEVRRNNGGKREAIKLEIDFVANKGDKRYYIQSAYSIPDEEKHEQEVRPFRGLRDGFKRILLTNDDFHPYYDEEGILNIGILRFLKDEDSLDI